MSPSNIHATALVLGERGILIRGASGAGKTTLALGLIQQACRSGIFSALVADDQSLLAARNGRLIARAPQSIAGLAEVYGLGPRGVRYLPAATIDLIIDLADGTDRLPDPQQLSLHGISLPQLVLPARNIVQSQLAIAAWLGWSPFAL